MNKKKQLSYLQKYLGNFENLNDSPILPNTFAIIRLDARRFHGWAEGDQWPYDKAFFNSLARTAYAVMVNDFQIAFSYIHGDEISFFLHQNETSNPRRRSQLHSLFASKTTAYMGNFYEKLVVFHTKLGEYPNLELVSDYFLWQLLAAKRNLINYCLGGELERQGKSKSEINKIISPLTTEERLQYAKDNVKDFAKLPKWMSSGLFLFWSNQGKNAKLSFDFKERGDFLPILNSSLDASPDHKQITEKVRAVPISFI